MKHEERVVLPVWRDLPAFGLYLDQVLSLTAAAYAGEPSVAPLTSGMVNSYVKTGLVDRPDKKKYSRAALAQLLMITFLKQTSSMDTLQTLLHPDGGPDTEAIYEQFRTGYGTAAAFVTDHPELTRLDCALIAAVCQTACHRGAEEEITGKKE